MSKSQKSQGIMSIFLLIVVSCGSVGGVLIGLILEGAISNRVLLAILTALLVIGLVHVLRLALGRQFPSVFLARRGTGLPRPIAIGLCATGLVAGFAGFGLSSFIGVTSGAMIGFLSGTLSALLMAILVILYFRENPQEGIEF